MNRTLRIFSLATMGLIAIATPPNAHAAPLELDSISRAEARSLAAFAREALIQHSAANPRAVAWSQIEDDCNCRADVLQYVLGRHWPPGTSQAIIDAQSVTDAELAEIENNPRVDMATLVISGPLFVRQHLALPAPGGSAPISSEPERHIWTNHVAVVLNVDNALNVLDLSVANEPMPIDAWIEHIVPEGVDCPQVDAETYDEIMVAWGEASTAFSMPPRPDPMCGYQLKPIFDGDSAAEFQGAIETLESTSISYPTHVQMTHGYPLTNSEIPDVISDYVETDFENVCAEDWAPGFLGCHDHVTLRNGVTAYGHVDTDDSLYYHFYAMDVQPVPDHFAVDLRSDDTDADLYVRQSSWPKLGHWDCRPWSSSSNETCAFEDADMRHLGMVRGYWGSIDFELTPRYSRTLMAQQPFSFSLNTDDEHHYSIEVPSGVASLEVELSGATGDADLYVRYEGIPGAYNVDCSSTSSSSNERCTISAPQAGRWYIKVLGFYGAVDYEVEASLE